MGLSCPTCGRTDEGGFAEPDDPENGPPMPDGKTAVICHRCHSAHIFDRGPLGAFLRVPTEEELAEIADLWRNRNFYI